MQINIVYGTKAQLIKMLSIMNELDKNDIAYHVVDTGQHSEITKHLRNTFKLPEPDFFLFRKNKNISALFPAGVWILIVLFKSFWLRKKIFNNSDGICIVHGDTVSTLLGLIMGKLAGLKVGHVEAGERTHKLFHPFPEEIIRIIVDKFCDVAFSSSGESFKNLIDENVRGEIIDIKFNTIVDAIVIASKQKNIEISVPSKFVLASIHRFETIQSKKRMQIIVDTLYKISEKHEIIWGLHEPTIKQLKKYKLLEKISSNPKIHIRELWDYFPFIKAISTAEFLLTDGGGPQEESWFLGTPCMLMRSETERELHPNVYVTNFEDGKIDYFVNNYKMFKTQSVSQIESPSKKITKYLLANFT